jgi:hypothetical protein
MAVRVQALVGQSNVRPGGYGLIRYSFFVSTGSMEVPIVSIADNNAFPDRCSLYAHEEQLNGKKGVKIDILYVNPVPQGLYVIPDERGVAVNIDQPGMAPPYDIYKA